MSNTTFHNILTKQEYQRLLSTAHELDHRYGFTVYMLGHTGMRTGELAHFRPDWFDAEVNLITIPESQDCWQSKSRKSRSIPLPESAIDTIDWYLSTLGEDAYGYSPSTIHRHVAAGAEEAGLDSVTPSDLRYTLAQELRRLGVQRDVFAAVLDVTRTSISRHHTGKLPQDLLLELNQQAKLDTLYDGATVTRE